MFHPAFWELSGRFPDLCGKYLYDSPGQGQPTERMLKISGHSLFTRGSFVGSASMALAPKSSFLKKKEEPKKVKSKEKGQPMILKINHSSSLVLITRCFFLNVFLNSNIFQIRDLLRSHFQPFRKKSTLRWVGRTVDSPSPHRSFPRTEPQGEWGKDDIPLLVFGGGKIRESEKNDISDFCLHDFLTCILQVEHC